MKKILRFSLAFTICVATLLQVDTAVAVSPHLINGIGEIIENDMGRPRGMGGAGIANSDGVTFMRSNPALLGAITQPLYILGGRYVHTQSYGGGEDIPTLATIQPELIRLVMPLYRGFVVGWGLSPYSRTDSYIEMPSALYTDTVDIEGGVNVSTTTLAARWEGLFEVGLSLNYNFGSINEEWRRMFSDDGYYSTSYTIKNKFKGYSGTFGVVAHLPRDIDLGLGYTTESTTDKKIYVRKGIYTNPDVLTETSEYVLPASFSAGIHSTLAERLDVAFDVETAYWEEAASSLPEAGRYNDTMRLSAGIRYIPSDDMDASYLATLPLSAGFRYRTLYYMSYPKLETIDETAVTLGVEIPFKNNRGRLMTSCIVGTRGDKSTNGWEETFFELGMTLQGVFK